MKHINRRLWLFFFFLAPLTIVVLKTQSEGQVVTLDETSGVHSLIDQMNAEILNKSRPLDTDDSEMWNNRVTLLYETDKTYPAAHASIRALFGAPLPHTASYRSTYIELNEKLYEKLYENDPGARPLYSRIFDHPGLRTDTTNLNPVVLSYLEAERQTQETQDLDEFRKAIEKKSGFQSNYQPLTSGTSSATSLLSEDEKTVGIQQLRDLNQELGSASHLPEFTKMMEHAIKTCKSLTTKKEFTTSAADTCYKQRGLKNFSTCNNSPSFLGSKIGLFAVNEAGQKDSSLDFQKNIKAKLKSLMNNPDFQFEMKDSFRQLSEKFIQHRLSEDDTPQLMVAALWEQMHIRSDFASRMLESISNPETINSPASFDLKQKAQNDIQESLFLTRTVNTNVPFDSFLYQKLSSDLESQMACYASLNEGQPYPSSETIRKEMIDQIVQRENCHCSIHESGESATTGISVHSPVASGKNQATSILGSLLHSQSSAALLREDPVGFFVVWKENGGSASDLVGAMDGLAKEEWDTFKDKLKIQTNRNGENQKRVKEGLDTYLDLMVKPAEPRPAPGSRPSSRPIIPTRVNDSTTTAEEKEKKLPLYFMQLSELSKEDREKAYSSANASGLFTYELNGNKGVKATYHLPDGSLRTVEIP